MVRGRRDRLWRNECRRCPQCLSLMIDDVRRGHKPEHLVHYSPFSFDTGVDIYSDGIVNRPHPFRFPGYG